MGRRRWLYLRPRTTLERPAARRTKRSARVGNCKYSQKALRHAKERASKPPQQRRPSDPPEPPTETTRPKTTSRTITSRTTTTKGKPIFSSDASGLVQAAEYIGIRFRFNLASNGMEVRPENDTMRRQLHSTGSTWPEDWRQMDDAIDAKIRAIIADECLNKKAKRQVVKWRSGNWKDCMLVISNDFRVDPWLEWITRKRPRMGWTRPVRHHGP